MYRTLLSATALLTVSTAAMGQSPRIVSLEGAQTANQKITVGASFQGTALLQSFRLRYVVDDHHITTIGVMPEANRFTATFTDKNGDDPFHWTARFATLKAPDVVVGEVKGENEIGEAIHHLRNMNSDYVFVLRGFRLSFARDYVGYGGIDRHIDEVGVRELNGAVHIGFNDKNNDDRFTYHVKYALVPRVLFAGMDRKSGNTKGAQAAVLKDGIPVIRGFRYRFRKDDHHLREFGVDAKEGHLIMSYFDKNRDDPYIFDVELGLLKEGGATPTSTTSRALSAPIMLNARILN